MSMTTTFFLSKLMSKFAELVFPFNFSKEGGLKIDSLTSLVELVAVGVYKVKKYYFVVQYQTVIIYINYHIAYKINIQSVLRFMAEF